MQIVIAGSGYVGLVAAAGFAETGNHVTAVDVDTTKLAMLREGRIPFYEPGLDGLVQRNAVAGRLRFSSDMPQALKGAQLVFVAVGTPMSSTGAADLSAVEAVVREVAQHAKGPLFLVMKSTVPVGTNAWATKILAEEGATQIEVVSNPEFLKEGAAVDDFFKPDRVVVGVHTQKAGRVFSELYAPFTRRSERMLIMGPESAEMTKYAANCLLATRITFMNEIANLCDQVGADVTAVRRGIGSDSRIGTAFLFPGVGYGGSCFPKDVNALIHQAQAAGGRLDILTAVDAVNAKQKSRLVDKLHAHYRGDLAGKKFAFWGISFKANTDDIREAPALVSIDALLEAGAHVVAHDPQALDNLKRHYGDHITYETDAYAACRGANALLVHTEWNEYRSPDFRRLAELLADKLLLDGRNLYNPVKLKEYGISYHCIGRPLAAVQASWG